MPDSLSRTGHFLSSASSSCSDRCCRHYHHLHDGLSVIRRSASAFLLPASLPGEGQGAKPRTNGQRRQDVGEDEGGRRRGQGDRDDGGGDADGPQFLASCRQNRHRGRNACSNKSSGVRVQITKTTLQITNLSLIYHFESCVIGRASGSILTPFRDFTLKETLVREFYLFCKRQLTQKRRNGARSG